MGVSQKNIVNNNKTGQSFAMGALIMAIGMIIVKVAGAAFKVPLSYILGGVGTGYFSTAYTIYTPIYALATAGLPIAISRIVSSDITQKKYKDVRFIHKVSVPLFVITGLVGTILMFILAFPYVKFINSPGSLYSLIALAPTVFFSCLISIYKGYYEGLRNMIPTAISEIIESIGKVVFGVSLAGLIMYFGLQEYKNHSTVFGVYYETESLAKDALLPWASAGAVLGITLGAVAGYLYMLIKYKKTGDHITLEELQESPPARSAKELLKKLLKISIPVALGAAIMNIASAIDATLVQRRLSHIMSYAPEILLNAYRNLIPENVVNSGNTHIFLAGCFGYMNTITMFLPTITQGFAISALPNVTAAWVAKTKEKIQKNIETVLKITSIVSFPLGLGMSVLSYPIMDLVYNTLGKNKDLGEIAVSAQIMSIYAIGIIFVAIGTPLCSILQAVGRADIPLKILTIGVILKVLLNYVLVGIPEINIQGAGIGTLACYLFVCISSLIFLKKETKTNINYLEVFIKPIFSSILCAVSAYTSHGLLTHIISYKLATVISIIISGFVYLISLILTRTVTKSDLESVPKLKRFAKFLR